MLAEQDIQILIGSIIFLVSSLALVLLNRGSVKPAVQPSRQWLASDPAKQWGERFFLQYSLVWIPFMAVIVVSQVWRYFGPWSYLITGSVVAAPCFLAPLWLQSPAEAARPFWDRYWVKANVWIAIFSYVGNYFWTHYFYILLRASYTLVAHRINDVPICMFLFTHAYFCTYHAFTTVVLRRWWTSMTYATIPAPIGKLGTAALVFLLSYITAFMEAFTIQGFPYYHIEDRAFMYTVGAIVYGIYFVVSFPMFTRLDEDTVTTWLPAAASKKVEELSSSGSSTSGSSAGKSRSKSTAGRRKSVSAVTADAPAGKPAAAAPSQQQLLVAGSWTVTQAAIDSLAASMLVTILLDLWRLGYAAFRNTDAPGMLPWVPK